MPVAGLPPLNAPIAYLETDGVATDAVAFFAVWSVLSNLFCALLIFVVVP